MAARLLENSVSVQIEVFQFWPLCLTQFFFLTQTESDATYM